VTRRETGGGWAGALGIESAAGRTSGVAAAASPTGDVVVGYGFAPNALDSGILDARALDVASPLVRSVAIPASGTAGQPVSYAVTAADAWSPTSTVWSFGDGVTASGASVSHTFAAAGSYAVSVTTTDAVGNASTRTGTTVVAAAPVVTPPAATPKPTLTGVKLTRKTIHVKGSDDSPKATKLKLKLNTDAKVKVLLKRTKKVDGKTVKATVKRALEQGSSVIKLTSKIGGKKLSPGTYKVVVTAKNGVGTSVATMLKLTIKP
jgi:PKD repeat protein